MRPVSTDFIDTLTGSHKMFSRVRVLTDFQTGTAPVGGTEIPIISGSVSSDAKADIRSSADLTTSGDGMFPLETDDIISPYGNELFIERGLDLPNGTREVVSLGYFRIYNVEQASAPDYELKVTALDRMSGIVDAKLLAPVGYSPGTTLGTIISHLVLDVYPFAEIEYDDTNFRDTPITTHQVAEEDRFAFLHDIVTSFGKIMYWDYRGILVIKTPPSATAVVWRVNAGQGGVLINMARSRNREGVFNGVVTLGESVNENPPVRAVTYDNNPASPTYFWGRFGQVPFFYSSSLITTEQQALDAAQQMLRQTLGLPQIADFTAITNPALEPFDAVIIEHVDSSSVYVVDTLNIGLMAEDAMTATTRKQIDITLGT